MKWLNIQWYKYLFSKPAQDTSRIKAIICRARNHPNGVIWFNPNGFEPDMHCKDCDDDLG